MTQFVRAFRGTEIAVPKSMENLKKLLSKHDISEFRYTELDSRDNAPGQFIIEFVAGDSDSRRGVRLSVGFKSILGPQGGQQGSTPRMAARALFWYVKSKFDAIDYGIEEFDVAFMPHLVTAIGPTFAEEPSLISQVIAEPERLSLVPGRTAAVLPERTR